MARYILSGKEVTEEEFYNTVFNKIEPFFLDEVLTAYIDMSKAKGENVFEGLKFRNAKLTQEEKTKIEEIRTACLNTKQYLGLEDATKIFKCDSEEELESILKRNMNIGEAYDLQQLNPTEFKISPNWSGNNTGGTVFEKIQESALPSHPTHFTDKLNEYITTNTGSLPDSYFKSLNSAQEKFVENLDVYNAIMGHSTRHKARKEIKPENIWNDEKRKLCGDAIIKHKQVWDEIDKNLPIHIKEGIQNTSVTVSDGQIVVEPYINEQKVGKKETEGKIDYSEINLNILDLMAERFTANKHKYPKGNMLKVINKEDLVWAAFRHIKKMLKPKEDDPETFKEHLVATLCNMSMILDQLERE